MNQYSYNSKKSCFLSTDLIVDLERVRGYEKISTFLSATVTSDLHLPVSFFLFFIF